MTVRMLSAFDSFLHWSLDWYIHRTLPGWGRLQVWQWRLCNLYEERAL